jgi:hypothetical protein
MRKNRPEAAVATPWAVAPRTRRALVGLLVVVTAVAVVGCKGRTPVATDAPALPDASAAAPVEPTDSPTPSPAGTVIVTLKGTGDKTSGPFTATGDSVDVEYTYTCQEASSFTLSFYGTNGSPELPDVLVDDFAAQGADTITESLNGASGPFTLGVVSPCAWTVKVLGTP